MHVYVCVCLCVCVLVGAHRSPPVDVCHVQFQSKIAFKMVWCPGKGGKAFDFFTLVDDDGTLLQAGHPDPSTL